MKLDQTRLCFAEKLFELFFSSAKVCKSRRSRIILQNAKWILSICQFEFANIGFDTTEKEPSKVSSIAKFGRFWQRRRFANVADNVRNMATLPAARPAKREKSICVWGSNNRNSQGIDVFLRDLSLSGQVEGASILRKAGIFSVLRSLTKNGHLRGF